MVDANIIYDIVLPAAASREHPDLLTEEYNSNWDKGADVTLTDDTTYKQVRSASLKAVSSGTDDVYYYPDSQDLARDMTGADCICFWYRSSVTNSFRVSIHTDSSNYYYEDVTPAAADTWYFALIKFTDMSETGTFDITDVDYVQFDHKNNNRTMYVDMLAIGTVYEVDNITDASSSKGTNKSIFPRVFSDGDFIIPMSVHSRKYMVTFVVADDTLTDQQLLDEMNVIESKFIQLEPMIYHSEPSGLKRTIYRGIPILPDDCDTNWSQGQVRHYIVSFSFIHYTNPDLA